MYGLIIEAMAQQIRQKHGEEIWQEVRRRAGVPHHNFSIHKTYSETVTHRICKALTEVTGQDTNTNMSVFGTTFVSFVARYGYDRILRVLGRNLRDFLNGLDNLHEYLRFSYPKMKPPSFYVEKETAEGLTLHYRSKRKGFVNYVIGQIKEVALQFYNLPVEIEVENEQDTLDVNHVILKLYFNNTAFVQEKENEEDEVEENQTVSSDVFFDVFPFHIVFNSSLTIINIGSGLQAVMPNVLGQSVDEIFQLLRPLVEFTYDNVKFHLNNVFEIISVDNVNDPNVSTTRPDIDILDGESEANFTDTYDDDHDDLTKKLKLKGQMMLIAEWNATIFLGTPIMDNLEKMFNTGLYINDLSMHDSSRDLVLAGTQQSAELKLALDQEQQKSKKLEDSMKKLDTEMKRTDQLLYQMIPKSVADRLRRGEAAMATCEVFDEVTILFSDVVGFTRICSQITPMAVVSMLNSMYTLFDKLSEKHKVYKVETIGDAYMVVSGAPIVTVMHALYVCDMAFEMLEAMTELIDPSTGKHMGIRVGIHSGTVVAGVVGLKMPRYCLFGDTVNTASRMEAAGEAMKIHVSETTFAHIEAYKYVCEERGTIDVKGKGTMKTYWLLERPAGDNETSKLLEKENARNPSQLDRRADSSLFILEDGDTRSLYSPVLPDDVMKMSPAHYTKGESLSPGDKKNLNRSPPPDKMKNGNDTPNNQREDQSGAIKTGDIIHNKLNGKAGPQESKTCAIL